MTLVTAGPSRRDWLARSDIQAEELDLITGISLAMPGQGANFLERQASDRIEYFIQHEPSSILLAGLKLQILATSKQERRFINTIFVHLDPIIDADFVRIKNKRWSLINLYNVKGISGSNDNLGLTLRQGEWFDLLWKEVSGNRRTNSLEKETLVHEIGHALGLRHPFDDPWNSAYTTADTAMSYNSDATMARNPWFTANDLAALVRIWGPESDEVTN